MYVQQMISSWMHAREEPTSSPKAQRGKLIFYLDWIVVYKSQYIFHKHALKTATTTPSTNDKIIPGGFYYY